MIKATLNTECRHIQIATEGQYGLDKQKVAVVAKVLEPKYTFYIVVFEGNSAMPHLINGIYLDFEGDPNLLSVLDKR